MDECTLRILSIDPSLTSTGWAIHKILDGVEYLVEAGDVSNKMAGMDRINMIVTRMRDLVVKYNPHFVAMEGAAFGARSSSIVQLAELAGILKYACHELGKKVVLYPPTTVKSGILGNGKADKKIGMERYRKLVVSNMPYKIPSFEHSDPYDAICVGRFAIEEFIWKSKSAEELTQEMLQSQKIRGKLSMCLEKITLMRLTDAKVIKKSKSGWKTSGIKFTNFASLIKNYPTEAYRLILAYKNI